VDAETGTEMTSRCRGSIRRERDKRGAPSEIDGTMRVLPEPDSTTAFYWRAAREHRLDILRCGDCSRWVHYPREDCPACGGKKLAPERVSGRGVVHTFTIAHHPGAGIEVPFILVLVELEEQAGLRVLANLLDCPLDRVRAGLRVEVTFQDVGGDVVLPQFRPA
jgi:uncharacterized protein